MRIQQLYYNWVVNLQRPNTLQGQAILLKLNSRIYNHHPFSNVSSAVMGITDLHFLSGTKQKRHPISSFLLYPKNTCYKQIVLLEQTSKKLQLRCCQKGANHSEQAINLLSVFQAKNTSRRSPSTVTPHCAKLKKLKKKHLFSIFISHQWVINEQLFPFCIDANGPISFFGSLLSFKLSLTFQYNYIFHYLASWRIKRSKRSTARVYRVQTLHSSSVKVALQM